jgi:poly(hydroxyalkanoate) depolymerase family esterase
MSGLGETTARLTRLRREWEAAARAADGRRLPEVKSFGTNPGGLRMFQHLPRGLGSGAPLVVALHGCTQTASAYAWQSGWATLADRYGFGLVAPEQSPANNPTLCFNWFEPGDVARDEGEAASIRAMVGHALGEGRFDPARVYVTGLSAGGAMAAVMLAAYPEVFAAGAVVAGLPVGAADNAQEAFWAMRGALRGREELAERLRRTAAGGEPPPISIWHGDADATVLQANAVEIARQWAAVQGLARGAGEVEAFPGRTRTVWRAPNDGRVLVELNLLQGFGHGAPLSTAGPEGLGEVGPYMLEAGVSSTLEIARFWGLAPAPAVVAHEPATAAAALPPKPALSPIALAVEAVKRRGLKP